MEYLYNRSQQLIAALNQLNAASFESVSTIDVNCSILPKKGQEGDCRYHPEFSSCFSVLMRITSPALYWFEVTSSHTAHDLYQIIPTLNSKIDRSVPAYRKAFNNWDSKILYVGKVKSKIIDRMVVHFGYGRDNRTQGLQLCHWAADLDLQLKLHYITLPKELSELAGVFEVDLAKNLKPIFGKHK